MTPVFEQGKTDSVVTVVGIQDYHDARQRNAVVAGTGYYKD
jgi:hypothetical protein